MDIEVTSTIPANATATLVIDEDQTGDSSVDASDSFALSGGTETFVSETLRYAGNTHRVDASFSNTDRSAGASIDSVVLSESVTFLTNFSATPSGGDVDLSWTEDGSNHDFANIYRATESGAAEGDYTLIDTVPAGTTSYTDTTVLDGERYHYRVQSELDSGETGLLSDEDSAIVPIPNVTLDSATTSTTTIDLAWTNNHETGAVDGIDIAVKRSSAGSWTIDATLSPTATSHTIAGLLTGEEFDIEIRPYSEHTTPSSPTSTAVTTDFAAITGLMADASVEDELTPMWDDTATYGSYHVQHRVTGSGNPYTDDGTTDEATPQLTIPNLLDGEEYDIRVRHQTEHGSGAWTEITPVTLLPAPSGATVDSVSKTSVTISATDNADNEDGVRLLRAEKRLGSFGTEQEILDEVANTETFVDDTALPGTTYRYRVEAYTEHVVASTTIEATTTASDLSTGAPSTGWYVEIDHPSGTTLTPQVIENGSAEPRRLPTLNGLPRVQIPVPQDDKWESKSLERAPCRVWKDGERQPIERLIKPRQTPEATILFARGGEALLERVERSVTEQDAHLFAEGLIQTAGLTANVDAPDADTTSDTPMLSADAAGDFEDGLAGAPFADDSPVTYSNGVLKTLPSAGFTEAEDGSLGNTASIFFGDQYSGGEAVKLDGLADSVEMPIDVDYRIPTSRAKFGVRLNDIDDTPPGLRITVDETTVFENNAGTDFLGFTPPAWLDNEVGFELSPGTHTLKVEVIEGAADGSAVIIDCATLFDDDNQPGVIRDEDIDDSAGETLSWPELHPSSITVETIDVSTAQQVVGGRLEVSTNSTARNQAISISNDQGQNWITASNATVVEGAFAGGTPRIRARFTLSSFDSGGGPVTFDSGTEIDLFDLFADLDDTPLVVNQVFDGEIKTILNEVAEQFGDFVWCVTCDQDGNFAVEWTQPGQREVTGDPSVIDFEREVDASQIVEKAVVYGTSRPVRDEEITADLDVAVDLSEEYLQPTGEIVRATDGTRYERSVDYEFDPLAGTVTATTGGAISDGETLSVDYQKRVRGTYELPSYDGDETKAITETIPAVTTERSADQAALSIVQQTSTPLITETVTIDKAEASWELVDALSITSLSSPALETWSLEDIGGQIQSQRGNRDRVEEVVGRLRSRLSAVASKI